MYKGIADEGYSEKETVKRGVSLQERSTNWSKDSCRPNSRRGLPMSQQSEKQRMLSGKSTSGRYQAWVDVEFYAWTFRDAWNRAGTVLLGDGQIARIVFPANFKLRLRAVGEIVISRQQVILYGSLFSGANLERFEKVSLSKLSDGVQRIIPEHSHIYTRSGCEDFW
jgi:hypothetical protein